MRTRVDGNVSPGTGHSPFQQQEFSSGIAEYCTQFQALADTAPTMMWRFGPDGQCKYFNTKWLEYRGRALEQERGAGWMEGVHPEDLNRCTTSYRSALETRQPFHLEFRIRRADSSYGWVFAHAVPQYLLDGSFVGYVGSLEESSHENAASANQHGSIEASKSARQALCQIAANLKQSSSPVSERRRSLRRKRKTTLPRSILLECLDISVTPLLVVDTSGCAVYCNRAFQAFAAQRLLTAGRVASNVNRCPKLARPSSSIHDNSTLAKNYAPEVQAWLDSDSIALEQDIRVSAQPLSIGRNQLTMFSINDTSQENRTRLLERAFLHDLVNAAGSIQMLIDLLTGGTSRQERSEYINLLQVSVNRLLSEIYHEKMMLDSIGSMPFNVHDILTALAEYYRKQHFGRNCTIEIRGGAIESPKLLGDQTLLVRMLDNMLRNAVEATSRGGVVTLGYRQIGGEVEFWVNNPNSTSENGRAKMVYPSITGSEKDRDAGTGQETKLLSELCGGTVAVSSDQQSGTTYSIRYPAAVETISPRGRYHTKHAS